MLPSVPAILPLSVLEAVQNIDTPPDDGLGALEHELAAKRLGLSPTVSAQVKRYREQVEADDPVAWEEALGVFRLVGRRPDAELVFADAGRRAARYGARELGNGIRLLTRAVPGKLGAVLALKTAGSLARRWLLVDLRPAEGIARADLVDSITMAAREDGGACAFYTAALGELLRLVAGIEGAMVHEACRGSGDGRCIWRATRAEGYE